MSQRRRKKGPREKDLTSRYMSGGMDVDRVEQQERFTPRSKNAEQNKILKTAMMRAAEELASGDVESLPVGEVIQVFSLYSEVEHEGTPYLSVLRKTLTKISDTSVVVGDRVRFRPVLEAEDAEQLAPGEVFTTGKTKEAVIEQILPRRTVLTRADSFKGNIQHPIVANADQMFIVASLREPTVKWGLIDRMLVAAQAGGLRAIVCLNKMDLAPAIAEPVRPVRRDGAAGQAGDAVSPLPPVSSDRAEGLAGDAGSPESKDLPKDVVNAREVLAHYRSLGVTTIETSVQNGVGLEAARDLLRGKTTVLAGHSGVGKSSLARAIQPSLDLRIGAISGYTGKGRHTTTSARRYVLEGEGGGAVVDTPGVKLFGLWGVTRENLPEFFPDVAAGNALPWRQQSFERILKSLPEPGYS